MKRLLIAIALGLLFTSNYCLAQSNSALTQFSVAKDNQHIIIFWTMRAGFTCYETSVEHSIDSVNFNPIYSYPGICGSNNDDVSYSYTHEYPQKNGYNYYRMNLGPYGYSNIVAIRFNSFEDKAYNIFPMPFNQEAIIYFDNPSQDSFDFSLYNTSGRIVYERKNIRMDSFTINREVASNGLFFFQLKGNNGKVIPGRLIIN